MFRRLSSLVGLILSLVVAGVFIAICIQVWYVKAEVNRQTADLAVRANAAGDAADRAITIVGDVITKAKSDLGDTRSKVVAPEPIRVNHFMQMAARQASINLTGSLERTLGAVVTASDTVVVAEAALDIVTANPQLEKVFGINPDQIQQTRVTLGAVAGELRQAQSILGIPISPNGELPTAEQLEAVDTALRMADGFKAEMARIVGVARARVNETKRLIDLWTWRLTMAATILCGFGAVGQCFVARFCLRRLHDLPA
ncbi:MAG: hypothetical protein C0467_17295 [Planctomycetaceae bacterium]|nr:hypothetical protein [Planctomycetaceae bacterium]